MDNTYGRALASDSYEEITLRRYENIKNIEEAERHGIRQIATAATIVSPPRIELSRATLAISHCRLQNEFILFNELIAARIHGLYADSHYALLPLFISVLRQSKDTLTPAKNITSIAGGAEQYGLG